MGAKKIITGRPVSALSLVLASILCAFILSGIEHRNGWLDNLKFNIGVGREAEREAIRKTIRLYDSTTSGLYASGGYLEELRLMPAENLLKRKHFQNIDQMVRDGVVMIFDLDDFKCQAIRFYGRNAACAIVTEQWAMNFQDAASRKVLSNLKAQKNTVRYVLRRRSGKWIVSTVERSSPQATR